MTEIAHGKPDATGAGPLRFLPPPPLFLLQPILARVARRVAGLHPSLFDRLGPHRTACFVIDPRGLPFVLLLVPDPENLVFRAEPRRREPQSDARIAGNFFDLLALVDGNSDGDALFFSRDLDITGNTEAVVCLRNALDDVEGSIAEDAAGLFGAPGRAILAALRRAGDRRGGS
ncbi:ubiquinone anaerobic biosynthesis accessory factor UbiT [Jhaorihella thermophila]|uniref:Predicted lipid carrier protein YhbT, contains SCP2 domain n=1 Tax=Jhaorihella thermophila TaxID=488547 RepID=A0A1H5X1V4_9RHOB|nr:SCP2 sterol-binding domain-containing protein [Jhaorihella thermophila]SEG05267.1 Predicted lipid carrier protein YhbT, contains SCP2 domain [Jhaorihella thermophila]